MVIIFGIYSLLSITFWPTSRRSNIWGILLTNIVNVIATTAVAKATKKEFVYSQKVLASKMMNMQFNAIWNQNRLRCKEIRRFSTSSRELKPYDLKLFRRYWKYSNLLFLGSAMVSTFNSKCANGKNEKAKWDVRLSESPRKRILFLMYENTDFGWTSKRNGEFPLY